MDWGTDRHVLAEAHAVVTTSRYTRVLLGLPHERVHVVRPGVDPARLAAELAKLSPAQRAAYDREEAARAEILARSKASGLPEYIETGKFHAKETLAEAVELGRTGEGMRATGQACPWASASDSRTAPSPASRATTW